MSAYGELQSGAFDYVPSKLSGHREDRRSTISPQEPVASTGSTFARQWSEENGAYIYVMI